MKGTASQIEVRQVPVAEVLALRLEVLRPGKPPETARFAGDDSPDTSHWAAFSPSGGPPLAIATLMRSSKPTAPATLAWQIRGMASAPSARGAGYGAAVLRTVIAYVAAREPKARIWCNARVSALAFYRAHGFEIEGPEFEIAGVGPHYLMDRAAVLSKE